MVRENMVSIVILTKNASEILTESLKIIFSQDITEGLEVIIVDSGSTDNTCEIIRKFPQVKLIENPPEQFQHGRTRNLGGKTAIGKYLVFLNGDAIPADTHWLKGMLDNLKHDENVAGVYSRHLPKQDCYGYMALELLRGMKPLKEISSFSHLSEAERQLYARRLIRFSTVSCTVRKELWDKTYFVETLPVGEDQEWAKRVLEAGYSIVYEPLSRVVHSHNYSLCQLFKYRYENAISFNAILNTKISLVSLFGRLLLQPLYFLRESIHIKRYCHQQKYSFLMTIREIFVSFFSCIVIILGEIYGNIVFPQIYLKRDVNVKKDNLKT